MTRITDLPERIAALPPEARARMARLFHIDRVEGRCRIPDSMREWTRMQLGEIADVEQQQVVRVTNVVTWEGALYNPLRSKRPLHMRAAGADPAAASDDIFAQPLRTTAEDVFGRVRGAHCITTGNIARWEGQCTVAIFDEPDPLAFTREQLRDYLRVALAWARAAHVQDAEARYLMWMWNGGIKAGASIPHAHAQMGLGRRMHYARVEGLRRAALDYRTRHGVGYFTDWLAAHEDLGLCFDAAGLRGFANLAATRNKDLAIFGAGFNDGLADALHAVLRALVDQSGSGAFNVAILAPPVFDGAAEDWRDFPTLVRIADRGSPAMLSSDIGALDVFAHNTIATDPFALVETLGLA